MNGGVFPMESKKIVSQKTRLDIIKEVARKQGLKVIDLPLIHFDEWSLWAPAEVIQTCLKMIQEHQKRFGKSSSLE